MNLFEKFDYIGEKYATRKYTKKDLADTLGMTQTDLNTALRLKNFHYGIQRTPNNMLANRLYNGIIFERQLGFLEQYNFNFN